MLYFIVYHDNILKCPFCDDDACIYFYAVFHTSAWTLVVT